MGPVTLQCLPQDILCNILEHLGLYDKVRLQLVSRKLYELLLSFPPGEGVWGECQLSDFSDSVEAYGPIDTELRGWLIRRVPHMTHIRCNIESDKDARVLCGLLPGLSGLIFQDTELSVELDTKRTVQLLCCKIGKQPKAAIVDFWHTLSDCLTELEIDLDWAQQQMRLQPQLLTQLTALTSMTLAVMVSDEEDSLPGEVLSLPELQTLHVKFYCGRDLALECPKLTHLTMEECDPLGLVSLEASLQHLDAGSSGYFEIHAGFSLTNFLDLLFLSIDCPDTSEEQLLEALPLMTKLQTLQLFLSQGRLLQSLPQSLCEVTLHLRPVEGWNDGVIPVLQQLPELSDLDIFFCTIVEGAHHLASLSCDLTPFMAMQKLRTLRLGDWQAWTPSSLRKIGEFHDELLSSGSKLKLVY